METGPSSRLGLEPLQRRHAGEMFAVLSDPAIYRYLDYGPPDSVESLGELYARLERGRSDDGSEIWLNWLIRDETGNAIGYVQATVYPGERAYIGYVLASKYWGRGYASEAVGEMLGHLESRYQLSTILAVVEVENSRSSALLDRLGFRPASPQDAARSSLSATERLYTRIPDPTSMRSPTRESFVGPLMDRES
jgi:RimJ/RimL family protein N-acetyltransferase